VQRRLPPLVLAAALALGACGDGGDDEAAATTTTAAADGTTTTATTAPATTTTTPAQPIDACPAPFAGNSPAEFDDAAGQYAALLTAVSTADATISFDVVQWLVGDDADAAYEAETGDPSGVPNDYFILNESDQVRTSPVADSADIRMIDMTSGDVTLARPASLADLADGFEGFPVWLTFDAGTIVGVCQQYVP
jgi:hypothetical protein